MDETHMSLVGLALCGLVGLAFVVTLAMATSAPPCIRGHQETQQIMYWTHNGYSSYPVSHPVTVFVCDEYAQDGS
jgi:hypothetical protein